MTHLDAVTWRDLIGGRLDDVEARRMSSHLDGGCETCDAFLAEAATRGEVDALDGVVDDVLLGLADGTAQRLHDEVGFARLRRRLSRRQRKWWLAGSAVAVAAAALLVALLLVPPGSDDRARWRPKGVVPTGVHVELEVLRASGVEIVPLARGGEVGLGETLLFRVRLSAPACVQLWLDGEQPRALLEQPVCLEPGAHTLAAGGEALGYGASAAGPLHFKVTTGNHPVSVGGGVESRFSVEVRGAER